MSYSTEERIIQTLFNEGWAGLTPIVWPNTSIDVTTINEWLRVNITRSGAFQAGMGDSVMFNRYPGVVDIQIFVKPGTGTKRAFELADRAADILRGIQVDGVNFDVPGIDNQDEMDGWYQVNLMCEFYRDDCETRG